MGWEALSEASKCEVVERRNGSFELGGIPVSGSIIGGFGIKAGYCGKPNHMPTLSRFGFMIFQSR